MTRRKDSVTRPFAPRFAARETMAYMLDMSADTFDKLVSTGALPAARELGGLKRWAVDEVFAKWNGEGATEDEADPFMTGLGGFRGKATGQRRPA